CEVGAAAQLQTPLASLVARCARHQFPQDDKRSCYAAACCAFSQLTIQGIPNLSVNMPKRTAQNVSAMGIVTLPPSESAWKRRSASAGSVTFMLMENPCGLE